MSSTAGSRPNSRSEQPRAGSKLEPSRSNSTSPKTQRSKSPNRIANTSKYATSKKVPADGTTRRSSSGTHLEGVKRAGSPSGTRKNTSSTGTKPVSNGGSLKCTDGGGSSSSDRSSARRPSGDGGRQRNVHSPTHEEGKSAQKSVLEKKSSPLLQRRAAASQAVTKKASPDESKPAQNTSPGTSRRATGGVSRSPRGSATQADATVTKARDEAKQKSVAHKQVNPGKPPSGASSTGAKSVKQPTRGVGSKTTNGGKASGVAEPSVSGEDNEGQSGSRGGSPVEKQGEKVRRASGGSTGDKKTAANFVKKTSASGGRESPSKRSSAQKTSASADSSPTTLRRMSNGTRPSGGSATLGVSKRTSFRRVSSSGSIPVGRKMSPEKKAGSVSPMNERRLSNERKKGNVSPKIEKKAGHVSSGTGRKTGVDKKGSENPTGRRSVRSHSAANILSSGTEKNDTHSTVRKISATTSSSSVGRSSQPKTLAGKVVLLDRNDLEGEDRLQSTLKLFGTKGATGAAARKAGRGTVIKSMGMGGATAPGGSRVTPVGRVGSPRTSSTTASQKTAVTRTGSDSTVVKSSRRTDLSSRERLHSSDSTSRPSAVDAGSKSSTVSPLSQSAKSKVGGTGVASSVKKTERATAPTSKINTGGEKVKNPAATRAKSGLVSRPSCRNTAVKSRIEKWSKKEEEVKALGSPRMSPVPPSPKSPISSSPKSPIPPSPKSPIPPSPKSPIPSSPKSPIPPSPESPVPEPPIPPSPEPPAPSSPKSPIPPSPEPPVPEPPIPPSPEPPAPSSPKSPVPPSLKSPVPPSPKSPVPPSPKSPISPSRKSPNAPSSQPSSPRKHPPLNHSSPRISRTPSPSALLSTSSHLPPSRPSLRVHVAPTSPTSPPASPRASLSPPPTQPHTSETPPSPRERQQRSQSPVVISSNGAPVKSRIAMWAERERESRESQPSLSPQQSPQHSPHASPKGSPNHSPKGLRRQSPVDKNKLSPVRSTGNSREGSVVSSKVNSASPPRQVPSIKVEEREEEMYEDVVSSPRKSVSNSVTVNDEDEVYEDIISSPKKSATSLPPADEVYEYVETGSKIPVSEPCTSVSEASTESAGPPLIQDDIYSTIPDVYDNFPRGNHLHEQIEAPSEAPSEAPKLPPRPDSMKSASVQEGDMQVQDIEEDTTVYADVENGGSSYTRLKPAYTEMPIFDDPSDSGEPASGGKLLMKSKSNLTPKTKRRWLRSPLFGRRKGSVSADDREIHSEGAGSDREREEKKSGEGLMRKLMGSRSSKSRKAVKQKSASSVKVSSKVSYDSDSDGSSSVEEPQSHLAASNTEESRTRSTSEIGPSDQLKAEIIPRSNSYSPAATAEVGYVLTTHKKLDPSSQRVVSSDPETLRESDEAYVTTTHKELNPLTQRVVSDTSLAQSSSNSDSASITGEKRASSDRLSDKPIHYRKSPSMSPQRGATQLRKSGSNNPLSLDIRSLIDNMGEGLEFCEEYSKKLNVPSLTEPTSSGSAPGGLRLPVPFQLKTGSSQPSLVTVGFDVQSGSDGSQSLSNGVGGGDTDEKRGVSDSSTASEGEEQGSSGPEQEDALDPMESSLDQGRDTRYVRIHVSHKLRLLPTHSCTWKICV